MERLELARNGDTENLYNVIQDIIEYSIQLNKNMSPQLYSKIENVIKLNNFKLSLKGINKLNHLSRFDFGKMFGSIKSIEEAEKAFGAGGSNALQMSTIRALDKSLKS